MNSSTFIAAARTAAAGLLATLALLSGCAREEQLRNACGSNHAWAAPVSKERDNSVVTRVIDQAIRVQPGMTVWDIGAGAGYWTRRLARQVGKTGKVIATDVNSACVEFIDEARDDWEVLNVQTRLAEQQQPCGTYGLAGYLSLHLELPPPEVANSADRILLVNSVAFDNETTRSNSPEVSKLLYHVLKQGGYLIYYRDYDGDECMSATDLINTFAKAGLKLVDEADPRSLADPNITEVAPAYRCRVFAQFTK